MRTDTPDFFGTLLWSLQAIFFTTWALWSLARHGWQPAAGVLVLLGLGTALLGYRRSRSLGDA
jgi:NO-binding membrane sensor protein with MHYT domain